MSRKFWLILIAAGLAVAGWSYVQSKQTKVAKTVKQEKVGDCRSITFEGQAFAHCTAIPGKHSIMTHVTGSDGIIYRGFNRLKQDIGSEGIAFAANAGMYDVNGRPIGYYVENGARLHKLNRNKGSGNFHLLPNGVFFGDAKGNWQVLSSDQFADQVVKRPEFGTQSGPMLLIDGKFHPKISENGDSLKIRNAVGVDAEGRAHFIISEEAVSFGRLARLMRDHAKTPNALFLDGTVSALWDPASGRMDDIYPLGPLIVVSKLPKSRQP